MRNSQLHSSMAWRVLYLSFLTVSAMHLLSFAWRSQWSLLGGVTERLPRYCTHKLLGLQIHSTRLEHHPSFNILCVKRSLRGSIGTMPCLLSYSLTLLTCGRNREHGMFESSGEDLNGKFYLLSHYLPKQPFFEVFPYTIRNHYTFLSPFYSLLQYYWVSFSTFVVCSPAI